MHLLKKESKIIVGEMIDGSCLIFKVRDNEIIKGLFTANGDEVWPDEGHFGSFNCGLCVLERESGYGYMNRQGEMVIEPKYLIGDDFAENRAWVSTGFDHILVNNQGAEIKKWESNYIPDDFSEGIARIIKVDDKAINYKTGYINTEGDLVIPFMDERPFESHTDIDDKDEYCTDGLIRFQAKYKYGFLDKDLNIVIPFFYKDALRFHDGLAIVKYEDEWGFINKTNDFVSLAEFQKAGPFYKGQALVQVNEKLMAINSRKEITQEFDYDSALDSIKGHYITERFGKLGLMDHALNEIFPPMFDKIKNFNEGILFYSNEKKDGVCNTEGECIEVLCEE